MNIENYMNDGASWQAQMVLAHLRAHQYGVIEQTWNGRGYDLEIKVGRFENCREQGYVFTITIPDYMSKDKTIHQKNWAVFEHRNSDDICVLVSDQVTINTPDYLEMYQGRGKSAYEKMYHENEAYFCAEYLVQQMTEFVRKHYQKGEE